jgi:hypothetical protein
VSSGSWTFLKVVGVIVGLFLMVGFGLCSVFGFAVGGGEGGGGIYLLAVAGAVIAALSGWMVVSIFRSARGDRDRDS